MPAPQLVSNPRRNSYHGLEDASESWIAQDFLTLDATSGETTLFAYASDTKILGLAATAATGVTSSAAVVSQIWAGDKLALDTYGTILSAAMDASTFIPGSLYELIQVGTRWYANFDTSHGSGLACLICEGEVQGSLKDKINAQTRYRALFRVLDSVLLQHVGQ